jgi:hypothetical protein
VKELLFILPILAAIAVVLGATRGEAIGKIFGEAGKSFGRLVLGIAILCVVLQGVFYVVPLLR